MSSTDLYEELGVERTADRDDIKRAYRKQAAKYHPDVNQEPGAEDKFKRICKAYMILYDDTSRYKYDSTGEAEKPSDRKPVDIEKRATSLLYQTCYSVIDKTSGSLLQKNLQNAMRDVAISMLKEVRQRLDNNKTLWKVNISKKKIVEQKLASLLAVSKSTLTSILEAKIKYINTQEILPCREKHRSLLIDKAIVKRAIERIDQECLDYLQEEVEIDPMKEWDESMSMTWVDPRNTSDGFGSDIFRGE